MDKSTSAQAEFSRLIAVDKIEDDGLVETITANPEERAALAVRFGILSLDAFTAELSLRRIGRGPVIRLEGQLKAELTQSCVVSLEPIPIRIEERFALLFAPEGRAARPQGPARPDGVPAQEDWPEPITDGRIDMGEAAAQQLALAIDPYPRKPGITLEDVIGRQEAGHDKRADGPFAKLASLGKAKR
jgi:uncharacterized metal-binding protein YceD (DUF177 family)